jgi:hypothetical protein
LWPGAGRAAAASSVVASAISASPAGAVGIVVAGQLRVVEGAVCLDAVCLR